MPAAATERSRPKTSAGLPPGPKGRFFFGNTLEVRRDILGFLTSVARDYGDVVRFQFFNIPVCLLSHPNDIEAVLVKNAGRFVKSRDYRALAGVLGQGLLTSEGDTWRRQRAMAQPAFYRENILKYAEIMAGSAERAISNWQDGEAFDLHEQMMRLTLEIVAQCLFGANLDDKAGDVGEALGVVMDNFNHYARLALVLPRWLALPRASKMGRAVHRLDTILYAMIAERRRALAKQERAANGDGAPNRKSVPHSANGNGGGASGTVGGYDDLLGMLLASHDESGGGMDDLELRDECMTLFLAGHETTALALSWAWYLLSENPEADERLAAELAEVLDGRLPTPADLPNLPYTDAVLKETMRLYPPAWGIGRENLEPYRVGGYTLGAHTQVFISPWVTHRDARFYPAPERFRPERWLDDPIRRGAIPRFAYFPFGAGPRVCIGAGFAQMEAALVLATVARRFRMKMVPGHPIALLPSVTLRPKHGIRVTVRKRLL